MFSMPDSNTKYTSCTGRLVNQDGGYPESSKFPALYYSLSPRTPTKSNNFNSHHRKNSSSAMSLSSSRKYIHLYKDHRNDPLVVHVPTLHRGATRQFPNKLYEMLSEASKLGFEDIISWQPHGRAFLVRKADAFVTEVMQRYFSQSKLTSYQRQLSLYGFARITQGKDRGAYYHELFLRGRPDLLSGIERKRVKGTGSKLAASPETEPDFYTMEYCTAAEGNSIYCDEQEEDVTPLSKNAAAEPEELTLTRSIVTVDESVSTVLDDESPVTSATVSRCEETMSLDDNPELEEDVVSMASAVLSAQYAEDPKLTLLDKNPLPDSKAFLSAAEVCEAELLAEFGQDVLRDDFAEPISSKVTTKNPKSFCGFVVHLKTMDKSFWDNEPEFVCSTEIDP